MRTIVSRQKSVLEGLQTLTPQGLRTILTYSEVTENTSLSRFLSSASESEKTVKIHRKCQKNVYNLLKREGSKCDVGARKVQRVETRRSVDDTFFWKQDCFYCESTCGKDVKHQSREDFMQVRTIPFRANVLKCCAKRGEDDWAMKVKRRILDYNDLVAAEARYHVSCYRNFTKQHQSDYDELTSPGRPVDSERVKTFNKLYEWLESEAELYTLSEVQHKMTELSASKDSYTTKWLKAKLQDKYGSHIMFTEVAGKSNVVCLKDTANFLINDSWYNNRIPNAEDEGARIVKTAAKLILGDIRRKEYDCNFHPSNEDIESVERAKAWLPEYLSLFLEALIKYPLKQVSIGHSIVHVTRPRSAIPPVTFGLGIEVDHVIGSKWLQQELFSLGFAVSPDEVVRYKQSVTENEQPTDYLNRYFPDTFSQWIADNVDHNPVTDGKGSLHAMGVISAATCSAEMPTKDLQPIKRQKLKKVHEIIRGKGIPIKDYVSPETSGLSTVMFSPLLTLNVPFVLPIETNLDLLWHSAHFFSKGERPDWSGYMSAISSTRQHNGQVVVSFLPILDLKPSDPTCIFSVQSFVVNQAHKLGVNTPILTFDQPLWHKAMEIATAKSKIK